MAEQVEYGRNRNYGQNKAGEDKLGCYGLVASDTLGYYRNAGNWRYSALQNENKGDIVARF